MLGFLEHLTFVHGPSQVGPDYNSLLSRCLACHISFENDIARKKKSGLITNALIELAGDSLETLKWTIMEQKFHYRYEHLPFPKLTKKHNQEAHDLCRRQSVERQSSENPVAPSPETPNEKDNSFTKYRKSSENPVTPSPDTPNEKDNSFTKYRKSSEDPYAIYKDL